MPGAHSPAVHSCWQEELAWGHRTLQQAQVLRNDEWWPSLMDPSIQGARLSWPSGLISARGGFSASSSRAELPALESQHAL